MNKEVSKKIIYWIKQEVIKFPNLQLKYTYNKNDQTHYIYFSPEKEYFERNFGDNADAFEKELESKFNQDYIVFLSQNDFNPKWEEELIYEANRDTVIMELAVETLHAAIKAIKMIITKQNIPLNDVKSGFLPVYTHSNTDIKLPLNNKVSDSCLSYAS